MKFPVKVPFNYDQHREAQCIVDYIRQNNLAVPKVYVDIGASDGVCNSNSRYFVHQGWTGYLFEPCPINFKLLCNNTNPNSLDVLMYQVAVGDRNGVVKFKSVGGLSKISKDGEAEVPIIMVKEMFGKEYAVKKNIGILDVDTEGGEEGILRQFMRLEVYPHFIIVEHQCHEPKIKEQIKILSSKYKKIARKGVNDIWHLR